MVEVLISITILLAITNLWFTFRNKTESNGSSLEELKGKIDILDRNFARFEGILKDELSLVREESNKNARADREEILNSFKGFENSILARMVEVANLQKNQLEIFSSNLQELTNSNNFKLDRMSEKIDGSIRGLQEQFNSDAKTNREELARSLKSFEEKFSSNVKEFNSLQKEKFDDLSIKQENLVKTTEQKLDKMTTTIEDKLTKLNSQINNDAFNNRSELTKNLKSFEENFSNNVQAFNNLQKQKFEELSSAQSGLIQTNQQKLESMNSTIESRLSNLGEQINKDARGSREELAKSLGSFEDRFTENVNAFNNLQKEKSEELTAKQVILIETTEKNLSRINETIEHKLKDSQEQINTNAKMNRDELTMSLKSFEENFTNNVKEFNEIQKQKFNELSATQAELVQATEQKLDMVRNTLQTNIAAMQADNNEKIEKMRETVDEKLHKTLEQRLGESFKLVSERLEQVHKGLGEMQNLATGVGDLKKVLSNVKTRGVFGEIQLEKILDQILTPEQYDKNVVTKKGSRENVEFAIRLPGKDEPGDIVYLPVDSKFPLDNYHKLVDAYEAGNQSMIEIAVRDLENAIKKCAKDIRDKYIDPPNTTDFGIMFLPTEGLYAEVVRRTSLLEILQRDYKINITGPTTLAALLNSLQMGFKTLAIEKRSSEVWNVLGAIKTEFSKFGDVLDRTQKRITEASQELDNLVGTRTRKIRKRLENIQSLAPQEAEVLLASTATQNED